MKYIGAHVSIQGGLVNAPLRAKTIGAKAFAHFTQNQRRWANKELTLSQTKSFIENCQQFGFAPRHILPHTSYLINLGHPKRAAWMKSCRALINEMQRCQRLGLCYLNGHPGAHLGLIKIEDCLSRIAEAINRAIDKVAGVTPVIENTAGQGSQVGYRFEHLAMIIEQIEDKSRIGICLDTGHLFAAGYDLRDKKAFDETFHSFDSIVGFKFLCALHLNDSKKPLGTHVDRHAGIGQGEIGLEGFKLIMQDPRFEDKPLILETPNPELWPREIELLYRLANAKTSFHLTNAGS